MPTVTFIDSTGQSRTVEAHEGSTLMEAAIEHEIPGIVAFCGGMCACGTCHCYVPAEWAARLPEPDENESDTLKRVIERRESSRLACQIRVRADLDGMTVTTPARQRTP